MMTPLPPQRRGLENNSADGAVPPGTSATSFTSFWCLLDRQEPVVESDGDDARGDVDRTASGRQGTLVVLHR